MLNLNGIHLHDCLNEKYTFNFKKLRNLRKKYLKKVLLK